MFILSRLFFTFILIIYTIYTLEAQPTTSILATSIPKSGSFLLFRCIELLTNKQTSYNHFIIHQGIAEEEHIEPSLSTFTTLLTTLYPTEFLIGHFKYTPEYDQLVTDKNFKVVFIIRDPRDQVVSRAFYIKNIPIDIQGFSICLSKNS